MEAKKKIMLGTIVLFIAITLIFLIFIENKDISGNVAKEELIKIGFIVPLTGPTASQGEQFITGKDFFLSQYSGKLKNKVQIIVEDTQGTPAGALSAVNKLINIDNVKVITGFMSGGEALAVAPVLEERKILFFAIGTSTPKLSGYGKYVFRHALLSSAQAEKAAEFTASLGNDNICTFYINDETGKPYNEQFIKSLNKLGRDVFFAQPFDRTQTDFRTDIMKLKEQNCTILYSSATPKTLGLFLKQSKEMGFSPKVISGYGIETDEFIKISGDASENTIITTIKTEKKFSEAFKKTYQETPKVGHTLAYDSMLILYSAMEKTKDNPDLIANYFEQMDSINGVTGKLYFNSQHDVFKEMQLKTVKNGTFVVYS